MSPRDLANSLHLVLQRRGYRSAMVSADRVSELRETIQSSRASARIDDSVYRQYAAYFEKMLNQEVPWARSIIAIAVPRPVLEVIFTFEGNRRAALIPPTYEHSIDETVAAAIEAALAPHGFRICAATVPLKLLATKSGLARYGKNNITYVEGMGSYYRLLTFYTDLPAESDRWQDPQVLDECSGCNACTKHCPTGAIDSERFQIRAERCMTFHNESTESFPQWIQASWHHCLVGCIKCQHYCPVNKDVRLWKQQLAELTEEETAFLLAGATGGQMPRGLAAKFFKTDLLDDPVGLARNLKSVIAATG